jgi:TolB protein
MREVSRVARHRLRLGRRLRFTGICSPMLSHRFTVVSLISLAALAATHFLPTPGQTVPVILGAGGLAAPDDTCTAASLSGSARIVAFTSEATNLLPADTDSVRDVIVANLRRGTALLASVSTTGQKGNKDCDDPSLDRRGQHVAFSSAATNLVDGDWNASQDVFLRDLKRQTTVRVSVASDGTESNGRSGQPAISGAGTLVAFASVASNLVPGDANGFSDVFVRDLRSGETRCISLTPQGATASGNSTAPAISASGRYVAFISGAADLGPEVAPGVQAYVADLKTGAIQLATAGLDGALPDFDCEDVTISANGRRVAFTSAATNLATADAHLGSDVFVRDLKKHATRLVSQGLEGAPADAGSRHAIISRNGKWLAFTSDASNLVLGDTNACTDVFRWGGKAGAIDRASISSQGEEGNGNSDRPGIQRNGRYISFSTRATNLFAGATDGVWSVGLRRP